MKITVDPLVRLYVMNAIGKGFSIFYFVLLPVFYAQKLVNASQIGYIGAILITMLIFGAIIVARWLHNFETKKLLQITSLVAVGNSVLLLLGLLHNNLEIIVLSYAIMGLIVGISMSGIKAVAAALTIRGDRYKAMAKVSMTTDIVRITFPLLVSGAIVIGSVQAAIIIIILAAVTLFILVSGLPKITKSSIPTNLLGGSLRKNKNFLYVQIIEFLDSFSSSQLFVFLPLIFLAKGYSIQSSLLLQSCIFLGYLTGRWFVSYLAKRYSGMKAVAIGEIGMVVVIMLLLVTNTILLLYVLTYILGIFARGTSPVIEALSMDTLHEDQTKKGTALHIVAGDSGSALGQLIFGIVVTWYGVNSPFYMSACIAAGIALLCLNKEIKI